MELYSIWLCSTSLLGFFIFFIMIITTTSYRINVTQSKNLKFVWWTNRKCYEFEINVNCIDFFHEYNQHIISIGLPHSVCQLNNIVFQFSDRGYCSVENITVRINNNFQIYLWLVKELDCTKWNELLLFECESNTWYFIHISNVAILHPLFLSNPHHLFPCGTAFFFSTHQKLIYKTHKLVDVLFFFILLVVLNFNH